MTHLGPLPQDGSPNAETPFNFMVSERPITEDGLIGGEIS